MRPVESTHSWIPFLRDMNRVRMTYGTILIRRWTLSPFER